MTGYGKAEASLETGKLTVEIRTLNGKSADISIKSQLLPKDKELIVRQKLSERLHRGTIDLFLNFEPNSVSAAKKINVGLGNISARSASSGTGSESRPTRPST